MRIVCNIDKVLGDMLNKSKLRAVGATDPNRDRLKEWGKRSVIEMAPRI